MNISIERRVRPNGEWLFSQGYSSLDAAKAACRHYRRAGYGCGSDRNMDFRIYHNDSLYLVNVQQSCWRLRWIPGNGKSRAEQA